MMAHDFDSIRIHPDREPDAIALLEGIKADSIRIGKLISDVIPAARAFPLLRHRLEMARASFHQVVQDCNLLLEVTRTYGGEP